MILFEKINALQKEFLNKKREKDIFNKFKKNVIIKNNEIDVKNINLSLLNNKNNIMNYITNVINQHPSYIVNFTCCSLDGITINNINNKNLNFYYCDMSDFNISSENHISAKFNNCKFNISDDSGIIIKIHNTVLEECTLNSNGLNLKSISIGKDNNSIVSIKNCKTSNENIIRVNIEAKSITMSLLDKDCNIEISANKNNAIDSLHLFNSSVEFNNKSIYNIKMLLMENSTVNNLSSKCDSIEFIGDCVFNNVNILKCNDMELCEYSSLTTGNVNINSTILQCQENSEINDTIDRFKWLASIKNIVAYNNFKLKYNGKLMYQQLKKSFNINIEEELISITNNISRKRR